MPKTEKALIIKGPLSDLREVLKIATVEGRKILKTQDVIVKPHVTPYGASAYLVVVEAKNGCDKALGCGGRENKEEK